MSRARPAAALAQWCARAALVGGSAGGPPVAEMRTTDWADFLRLCLAHAIVPLAWRSLKPYASEIPDLVARDLAAAFDANARRNLWLTGELIQTLDVLDRAGVAAVPWKGPLLAERSYGDLRLRQFYDLDLLVRRHQLEAARDLLLARGFRTEKRMTHAEQKTYVEHQGELELVRDSDGLWLELHTAIVPTYYAGTKSAEHVWQRIVRSPLLRGQVWALSPADELEALCVHGSKHRWERLAWIVDIGIVGRSIDPTAWTELLEGARARGTLRMVLLGLLVAESLCGAELPIEVAALARADATARRLAATAVGDLFDPQPSRFDALFFHARMRERPSDRARYLLNVAFTPSGADWETLRLPRRLFPLYALTRPVRLVRKYGARLLSRAR